MPSTYSPKLRFELIGTGEQAGTWGTTTNTNLGTLIEQAVAGYVSVSITDANYTLTALNGASDEARNLILNIVSSVTLTQTRSITCPAVSKSYVVTNATTGGFAITLTTGSGTTVSVPNGQTVTVFCDGTNVKSAVTYLPAVSTAGATLTGNLTFSGNARRITGDFSGASLTNRVNFQTSESNAPTAVAAIPNGTPSAIAPTNFTAFNTADPANAAYVAIGITTGGPAYVGTSYTGTASTIPVDLVSGGVLSARLPTTGGVLVGTTSSSGDVNNVNPIVAGLFTTQTGSISVVSGTSTAFITLPNVACSAWLISVGIDGSDPDNFSMTAAVSTQRNLVRVNPLKTGTTLIGITNLFSATNPVIYVYQNSGVTQTVFWSAIRIQ